MKTVIVLITLASVATAIPTVRNNIEQYDEDKSDLKIREKKSPLTQYTQTLSTDHGQEDKLMQNLKRTEVKTSVLEKRNPSLMKPIIVKKKFGYHVYRNSEEEMAHADPQENCSKQVKVKLCDSEPALQTVSDTAMLDHPQGVILEKEMQQSIKMAKDAVENLQQDLWKMEQNSKLSNSKENLHLDTELQQDIENARKVLEHIQQNIGNFESIDFQSNAPKIEANQRIDSKDAERLNQWKEAIENIHKNFEIARNIEDAFKNDEVLVHSEHSGMEKLEETKHLVGVEHSEQKSNVAEIVQDDHSFRTSHTPLLTSTRGDISGSYKHSSQAKISNTKTEQTVDEHNADMFVSPTNHKESRINLHSESLVSENILKERTENIEKNAKESHTNDNLKNTEVLPQLYEIEQMSDKDKQNPMVRAASNYEMEEKRENFDNTGFESHLENEGLNDNQQFNINTNDININAPLMKASALAKDQVNTATEVQSNNKAFTEVKADSKTPKEALADDNKIISNESNKKIADVETSNKNEVDAHVNDSKLKSIQEEMQNNQKHKDFETTIKEKNSEVQDQLDEVSSTKVSQVKQEDFYKMSLPSRETTLNEKTDEPKEFLKNRMDENQNKDLLRHKQQVHQESALISMNHALKSASDFHNEDHDQTKLVESTVSKPKSSDNSIFSSHLTQEKLSKKINSNSQNEEITHSHTMNEHLKARMEKNNNFGIQLHENHRLHNSFPLQLSSRPHPLPHHLIDHSSQLFKTVTETQNLNEPSTMRWAQQMRNQEHLSRAVQESQNGILSQNPMKFTEFNKQPFLAEKMSMRNIEDSNLGHKFTDNHGLQEKHLMQKFNDASNFDSEASMSNPMKSTGFNNQMPIMREQINSRMPPILGQQMMDSREVHDALSLRWAQNAPKDHSTLLLDSADEFLDNQHMDRHLSRFNNHFDSEKSHDFMSRVPEHLHIMKHAKLSDMDSSMQPSTQFGVKDTQWGLQPHGLARSSYTSNISGGGPGAVGVFPNANTGCGIPLLLSCSPSVVSGSLAKTHPSPISPPAYRSGDDFSYYMKRDANNIDRLSNIKVLKSATNNHKIELGLKKVE